MQRVARRKGREAAAGPDALDDGVVRLRRNFETAKADPGEVVEHFVQHAAIDAPAARRRQDAVEDADRGAVRAFDAIARESREDAVLLHEPCGRAVVALDVARGPFGITVDNLLA